MNRPTNYLVRMVIFLVLVYGTAAWQLPRLTPFFLANPLINAVIIMVEGFGVIWNLQQVLRLYPEFTWLDHFRRTRQPLHQARAPLLLGATARMLQSRADKERRITLSAPTMRTLLDGVASRLDESRELSRYVTGVMIFLGLLGTFWGLLHTVSSVAAVINGMTLAGGDVNAMFAQLKAGLAQPLAGMGTAFSASLFGLSGALILGFLDLTAGQAMNRFFNELEECLAGLTRLSTGAVDTDAAPATAYQQALLEQMAENQESLQRMLARGEETRAHAAAALRESVERTVVLGETLHATQQLLAKLVEAQNGLSPALGRLASAAGEDEAARAHLRNIELLLNRLIAEAEQGRAQSLAELRGDLKLLTRTLAGLAGERR